MIQQRNNILWFKFNGLFRYAIVHMGCNNLLGYYLVNEYPKSGGSWLGQMLAEAFHIPFPRNKLPLLRPSIMHGHYLDSWNISKAVILWRDGRDVLISQYYHSLFKNEKGNQYGVNKVRQELECENYHDIKTNLKSFIKYVYETPRYPRFTWKNFVDKWYCHNGVVFVKYEDLRNNTAAELQRVVKELSGMKLALPRAESIVDKFSFERQSNRKPGEEQINSFMRKGIIGDWKNCFNADAKKLFARFAGEQLIRLGYETDYSWVKNGD